MTILPLTYLGSTEWFARIVQGAGYGCGDRDGSGSGNDGHIGGGCNRGGGCVIDIGENWVRQTTRNRCEIMTSGGIATLTVPVHGGKGGGVPGSPGVGGDRDRDRNWDIGSFGSPTATKDIRIDNSKRWQHTHWTALVSAYRNSPYFDHYEERFAPVYAKKLNFLTDLNLELLNILTDILGIDAMPEISERYVVASPGDIDLRGKKALRRLNNLTPEFTENPEFPAIFAPENSENAVPGAPVASISPKNAVPAVPGNAENSVPATPENGQKTPKYTQVFSDRIEFTPGLSIVDLIFCEGRAALNLLRPAE
jgi:hypothetical protein